MTISRFGCLALAATISISLSNFAEAGDDFSPDNIIITGVRTPIAAGDMSTAVTVIGRDELDLRQSFQLADVLRDVPGLTVARSGSAGSQAQIRMRGSEANHVLVLIDGVEANDPASGDEFLFEHLSAMEVERIEVIRGPQSALWGSDAVSGVINIVTRKGVEGFDGGMTFEGGSFDTMRSSARVAFGNEKWRASLGKSQSESDGTNVSRSGDEDDGYDLDTVQARLSFDPSEAVSLDFTARHVEAHNEFDPTDYFVTGLPADGDRVNEADRTVYSGAASIVGGRWTHKLGVNWLESNNASFADGAQEGTVGAERLKASWQSTVEVSDGHRLTGAIDYRDTDFMQTGPIGWGDPNQNQSLTNTGYVLDYVGEVEETFTITASIRYDDNSDFDNVTTWRLGASYDLLPDTRLRGSYGLGQKAPTFIERYGFFSSSFIGNSDLTPEISNSWEIGIDHVAHEGRVLLGLTYFNAELEDEIDGFVWDNVNFAYTAANKDGESKRQGVETTMDAQLSDKVVLSANYTWTDAEEPNGAGGFRKELRRPEHAGAVALTWSAEGGTVINVNAAYVGDAEDIFFPPWPLPSEIVTLDSYVLVSASVQVPIADGAQLFGRVENALDETYEDVYGFATPGIALYGGIRVSF